VPVPPLFSAIVVVVAPVVVVPVVIAPVVVHVATVVADVALVVPDVLSLSACGLAVASELGSVGSDGGCVVVPLIAAQLPAVPLDGAIVLAKFTAILANVIAVCTDIASCALGEGGGYEE
jgi:hypothetical protein